MSVCLGKGSLLGMANGSPKNVGLGKFWRDLEIFEAFLISLEVSSFHVFVLPLFESRNFLPRSLGLGFSTRISASRRVSDFTIRHPYYLTGTKIIPTFNWTVISSSASTQRNGTESSNLKVQKSVAVLINVLGLHKDISIALVVIIMCYL